MPGVAPYLERGPATYTANVAIVGGQLVMPAAGGTIQPATAGAANVLGVAGDDAAPASSGSPLNFASVRPEVKVYAAPTEVAITYAAAATFGQKLQAAANAQVTPWITTGTADLIVGRCTEPAGVAAGGVGRVKLA